MNHRLGLGMWLACIGFGCQAESTKQPPVVERVVSPVSPLDADYEALQKEYMADREAFLASLKAKQAKGEDVQQCGYSPRPFLDRFEALAERGQPDAIAWCIASWLDAPDAAWSRWAQNDTYYESFRTLVEKFPDAPATERALRRIQSFCGEKDSFMRTDRALALCEAARARSSNESVRTTATFQEVELLIEHKGAEGKERAKTLLEELARSSPTPGAKEEAESRLKRSARLQVGSPAPDIVGKDIEGAAFKLSDLRGRIVVLDFWSFGCGSCVAELPRIIAMNERLAGAPFAFIGIPSDEDLDELKLKAARKGVNFQNIWPGGYDSVVRRDFAIWREPTIFVLDGTGTIRFVDARGKQLEQAVDALLSEMAAGRAADSK